MKTGILLCGILALATAASRDTFHDGLVAKWSPISSDPQHFYDIPRTRSALDSDSITWVEVDANSGDPFTVHCEQDNERYCVIFDNNGFIAGQQYSIAAEDVANSTYKFPYGSNDNYASKTRFGRQVWTGTAFFVSPAVLNAGGRSDLTEGTLVELWLQKGDSYEGSVQIPLDRASIEAETEFELCNCVPGMGIHYYYKMIPTLPCAEFDPWFLLYEGQMIVGIGFQNFGSPAKRTSIRHYNEFVPLAGIEYVAPNGPACLKEWVSTDGIISLHTFFISKPSSIAC